MIRWEWIFITTTNIFAAVFYSKIIGMDMLQMIMLEGAKATTETVDALRTGASTMKAMQKATYVFVYFELLRYWHLHLQIVFIVLIFMLLESVIKVPCFLLLLFSTYILSATFFYHGILWNIIMLCDVWFAFTMLEAIFMVYVVWNIKYYVYQRA